MMTEAPSPEQLERIERFVAAFKLDSAADLAQYIDELGFANRDALDAPWNKDPEGCHLTRSEKIIADTLWAAFGREVATKTLYMLLYGNELEIPTSDTIKVFIARIRKKLSPFNLEVVVRYGSGVLMRQANSADPSHNSRDC